MKTLLTCIIVLAGAASAHATPTAEQPGKAVTAGAEDLQSRAKHYTRLAAQYRALAVPGSKQMIGYFTLANRADRLAKRYRMAALEAAGRG